MPSVYLYLSRGLLSSTLELFEPVVASQLLQQKAFCRHNDEQAGQEVETSSHGTNVFGPQARLTVRELVEHNVC